MDAAADAAREHPAAEKPALSYGATARGDGSGGGAAAPRGRARGPFFAFAKNIRVYWIGATVLACWFLFVHAPPFLVRRQVWKDFPLLTHLVCAYSIYLACILNTVFTPTVVPAAVHTWIGRAGMVAGIVSFVLGFYCTWLRPEHKPDLGFAVGITAGGMGQLYAQYAGYRAIRRYKRQDLDPDERRKALREHVFNMVTLFVAACGIPAGIRFAESMLPPALETLGLILIIIGFSKVADPFGESYFRDGDGD